MLVVESLMELLESVQKEQVTRLGPVAARRHLACRRVFLDRKRQKLPLGESSKRTRDSGIQKTNDGAQDTVGSRRIASMQSQHTTRIEADHHGAVGVCADALDVAETEEREPPGEEPFDLTHHSLHPRPRLPAWLPPWRANELVSDFRKSSVGRLPAIVLHVHGA